ncbi:uroporphyrinogen-III synthase [Hahella ganghwensis]|uniref:uroporphyrinogen-III synthase n=1 Tax=Hahella ganghwensis TaxID=286420 RepID=UPI00036967C0|nr:uroporphyrinogen-III synthase [Hahella ganghwensis]
MTTAGCAGKILLTRSKPDNSGLKTRLINQGYDVRELPLLTITPLEESPAIRDRVLNIDQYDAVISTSKHASFILNQLMDTYWPQPPIGIHWFAMGPASAAPLQETGEQVFLPPSGNTSEDMLRHPELQFPDGKKILLVKGEGGRDTLSQELSERGAHVDKLDLYRRTPEDYTNETLQAVFGQWQPELIVVLSGEALDSLWSLCGKIGYALKSTRCIIPSQRVADKARTLELKFEIAASLKEDALAETISICLQK